MWATALHGIYESILLIDKNKYKLCKAEKLHTYRCPNFAIGCIAYVQTKVYTDQSDEPHLLRVAAAEARHKRSSLSHRRQLA